MKSVYKYLFLLFLLTVTTLTALPYSGRVMPSRSVDRLNYDRFYDNRYDQYSYPYYSGYPYYAPTYPAGGYGGYYGYPAYYPREAFPDDAKADMLERQMRK